jgi:hypothetical protein
MLLFLFFSSSSPSYRTRIHLSRPPDEQLFSLVTLEEERLAGGRPARGNKDLKKVERDVKTLTVFFAKQRLFVKIHIIYRRFVDSGAYPGRAFVELARYYHVLVSEPACSKLYRELAKHSADYKQGILHLSAMHQSGTHYFLGGQHPNSAAPTRSKHSHRHHKSLSSRSSSSSSSYATGAATYSRTSSPGSTGAASRDSSRAPSSSASPARRRPSDSKPKNKKGSLVRLSSRKNNLTRSLGRETARLLTREKSARTVKKE